MGLIYSDIPELEGSNTEISLANLAQLEGELEVIIEKRLAHLCELAAAIADDGEDLDVVKSIFLSIKPEGGADSGNVINENRAVADAVFSKYSIIERLTVLKELLPRLETDGRDMSSLFKNEETHDISLAASERIAYLKNSYNDEAYMQFSSLLKSPRAAYFVSISDVCESVYRDECEYCILPIETSADGKLLSFYELILKYNFKINAVYDLPSNGGRDHTRYALLSKRFTLRDHSLRSRAKNRYFEFLLPDDEGIFTEDLLCSAGFCSMKLRRIDTLHIKNDTGERSPYICPVLRADGADIKTFLAFLAIDCPDFIPIGLYMQI